MNELQVWFSGSETHANWIYFKTNATNVIDAINHFKETLKYSGIDLCDMKPLWYVLRDKDGNYITQRVNDETVDTIKERS